MLVSLKRRTAEKSNVPPPSPCKAAEQHPFVQQPHIFLLTVDSIPPFVVTAAARRLRFHHDQLSYLPRQTHFHWQFRGTTATDAVALFSIFVLYSSSSTAVVQVYQNCSTCCYAPANITTSSTWYYLSVPSIRSSSRVASFVYSWTTFKISFNDALCSTNEYSDYKLYE